MQTQRLRTKKNTLGIMSRACMLALIVLLMPVTAKAATVSDNLKETTQQIDKTKQQLKELEDALKEQRKQDKTLDTTLKQQENSLSDLRKRLIQATNEIVQNQKKMDDLEKQFEGTAAQIDKKMELLGMQKGTVSSTISTMIDLSLTPKEAYLLQKMAENKPLYQQKIIAVILPQLKQKEDIIAKDLTELESLKSKLRKQKNLLDTAAKKLQKQQKEMDSLVEQRQKLLNKTSDKKADIGAKIDKLGKDAQDLKELMEKLALEKIKEEQRLLEEQKAREKKAAEEAKRAELAKKASTAKKTQDTAKKTEKQSSAANKKAESQPKIMYPLSGKVITNFGYKDKNGIVSDGTTIEARGGSPIVAPYNGKIAFAGPFRGYGNIVIIQHPSGFYSFLSGFGHIDAIVGQEVAQGEPIGALPNIENKKQRLYFEWRKTDKPLKPSFLN